MVWEVGGLCSAVCRRCTLVANLSLFFDALLASFFNDFSGGIVGVPCGSWSALPGRPGDPTSNNRDTVSLRSSIARHAARPRLADTIIRTSATRAQARIGTQRLPGLVVGGPHRLMQPRYGIRPRMPLRGY